LRREGQAPPVAPPAVSTTPTPLAAPTTQGTARANRGSRIRPNRTPILCRADVIENVTSSDGKLAIALTGNVAITRTPPNGEYLELQADRAIVFTPATRRRDGRNLEQIRSIEDAITAAYLEGDVRISMTP